MLFVRRDMVINLANICCHSVSINTLNNMPSKSFDKEAMFFLPVVSNNLSCGGVLVIWRRLFVYKLRENGGSEIEDEEMANKDMRLNNYKSIRQDYSSIPNLQCHPLFFFLFLLFLREKYFPMRNIPYRLTIDHILIFEIILFRCKMTSTSPSIQPPNILRFRDVVRNEEISYPIFTILRQQVENLCKPDERKEKSALIVIDAQHWSTRQIANHHSMTTIIGQNEWAISRHSHRRTVVGKFIVDLYIIETGGLLFHSFWLNR